MVDSLDVCQSVLAGFFVSLRDGRLDLVQPRQLFRLLAVMAENKVRVLHAARDLRNCHCPTASHRTGQMLPTTPVGYEPSAHPSAGR